MQKNLITFLTQNSLSEKPASMSVKNQENTTRVSNANDSFTFILLLLLQNSSSSSSGGGNLERKAFPGWDPSYSCAIKLGDVFYLSGVVSSYTVEKKEDNF